MAKLTRELNLFFAIMSGVGIILGAGIYVLIGEAAGIAGNAVWLSFAVASVLAGLTGLSYAELSSMFTKNEAEYAYAKNAFGKKVAFLTAFLIIFAGVTSAAAVALGFGGYLSKLISFGSPVMLASVCVLVFAFITFYGIKQSAWLNLIFTLIEAGGLFFIIGLAWNKIGSVNYMEFTNGFTSIFEGAALIFFAYVGFEAIVKLAEETKNPEKVIPKALIWSIIISTIIYILVGFAAVSVIPWQQLAASTAPLADVAAAVLGSKAFILLSIIALFSTGNTVLIIILTTSRMLYGMGAELPRLKSLRKVHSLRKTPLNAIIITTLLTLMFVFMKDIAFVAAASNFIIFITFLIVNLSCIWLRFTMPDKKRPFKVPGQIKKFPIIPGLGVVVCSFMLSYLEKSAFVAGIILLVVGYIFYRLIVVHDKTKK